MRTIAGVLAVLLANVGGLAARTDESRTGALLTIRIYDSFSFPVDDMTAARTEAGAILREAGIEPAWLDCSRAHVPSDARCQVEVSPDEVVVRLRRSSLIETPSGRVPLGEAVVDLQTQTGWLATVFADRVASTSARAWALRSSVLGRVIAHEIGHLLLGSNHHSAYGLMRAVWTDLELRRLVGLEWHFSSSEARRLRAGILRRARREEPLTESWQARR